MSAYDAIIIGAGHNGLTAAAYLAKGGYHTLVLERRGIVGGACVTEEIHPGFRISRASYALGLLRPEVIRDLHLKRFGLEFLFIDPIRFTPFPDGKYMFVYHQASKMKKEISRFSTHDANSYADYLAFWQRYRRLTEPFLLDPDASLADLAESCKNADDQQVLKRVFFGSLRDLADDFFESDYVKATLCAQGVVGTYAGPNTPGTAYVLAHHLVCQLDKERDVWGYAKGGMGAVTQAMRTAAEHFGAEIRTDAEVQEILVNKNRVAGVRLKDGKAIQSKIVLSNADPKRTLLSLVKPGALDSSFLRQVRSLKTESAVMKINCAISELPDYKAYPGRGAGPQHPRAFICPSFDYLQTAWEDCLRGQPSANPYMIIGVQSAIDPTLAPAGKHVLSIFTQYAPYHLASDTWNEIREKAADNVIRTLGEYAPNVPSSIIARETLSPPDLEEKFYLTDGNIFHIEITPDQMLFRPVPGFSGCQTPIKGLYLCGSGAHGGGGVSGVPGYASARKVIRDMKATRGK